MCSPGLLWKESPRLILLHVIPPLQTDHIKTPTLSCLYGNVMILRTRQNHREVKYILGSSGIEQKLRVIFENMVSVSMKVLLFSKTHSPLSSMTQLIQNRNFVKLLSVYL